MEYAESEDRTTQHFQAALAQLAYLLGTTQDEAELAVLATTVPETLALWGIDAPVLHAWFREAVRDRYAQLTGPGR
jgi:hypothetical protein